MHVMCIPIYIYILNSHIAKYSELGFSDYQGNILYLSIYRYVPVIAII